MAETQVPFLDEPGISDPTPGKLPSHADLIKNIWYQRKGNFRGFQGIFILKIFILLKKKKTSPFSRMQLHHNLFNLSMLHLTKSTLQASRKISAAL